MARSETGHNTTTETGHNVGWSPRMRRVVSVLLVVHLIALVIGPCAVEPTSQLFRGLYTVMRPYIDGADLNHGYHFFAPEPGPSHLIRYEMDLADGTRTRGYFPHRDEHRPRLSYHRHFMLAEHLNGLMENGAPPAVVGAYCDSFARHLLHERQGRQVTLYLMRHLLPRPEQVAAGMKLDDASLYREKPLGTFAAEGT